MNPGAKEDPHDRLVSGILDRFRKGKAAEFEYTASSLSPGRTGVVPVVLIPERLFRDEGDGLLIVVQGRGSFTWDGGAPLNQFQMISHGIKPIGLAKELAEILNRVVSEFATARGSEQLLITAASTEKTYGNS